MSGGCGSWSILEELLANEMLLNVWLQQPHGLEVLGSKSSELLVTGGMVGVTEEVCVLAVMCCILQLPGNSADWTRRWLWLPQNWAGSGGVRTNLHQPQDCLYYWALTLTIQSPPDITINYPSQSSQPHTNTPSTIHYSQVLGAASLLQSSGGRGGRGSGVHFALLGCGGPISTLFYCCCIMA